MSNNKNITNNMNKMNNSDIRPFSVNFPEADLIELRRRVNATRWPEKETVTDQSQGVQLATIQKLASYWATRTRLAQGRSETELPTAVHYGDRWSGHSFHPRSLKT